MKPCLQAGLRFFLHGVKFEEESSMRWVVLTYDEEQAQILTKKLAQALVKSGLCPLKLKRCKKNERESFMPKYELMYILASTVSDDQVPQTTEQIKKYVSDFGGTEVVETQLGKKKLAYPIKKTRNGHYIVINFDMETGNVATLDAKIRAQDSIIIRYIIVNLDEHLSRLEKDKEAQAKIPKRLQQNAESENTESPIVADETPEVAVKEAKPVIELNEEELDKKIEDALNEDLLK